jgi:hypothetical protein
MADATANFQSVDHRHAPDFLSLVVVVECTSLSLCKTGWSPKRIGVRVAWLVRVIEYRRYSTSPLLVRHISHKILIYRLIYKLSSCTEAVFWWAEYRRYSMESTDYDTSNASIFLFSKARSASVAARCIAFRICSFAVSVSSIASACSAATA